MSDPHSARLAVGRTPAQRRLAISAGSPGTSGLGAQRHSWTDEEPQRDELSRRSPTKLEPSSGMGTDPHPIHQTGRQSSGCWPWRSYNTVRSLSHEHRSKSGRKAGLPGSVGRHRRPATEETRMLDQNTQQRTAVGCASPIGDETCVLTMQCDDYRRIAHECDSCGNVTITVQR
jgi:hypothetical protein